MALSLKVLRVKPEWHEPFSKALGVPLVPARVSASALASLQGCQRRFAFTQRARLQTTDYSSPRETGTLSHAVIEALYEGMSFGDAVTCGKKALEDLYKELAPLGDPSAIRKDLTRDLAVAVAMSSVFHEKFAPDSSRYRICGVEKELVFNVETTDADLKTIIDLLLYDTKEKCIWVLDIKTTSDDPTKRHSTSDFDPQSILYRLAAECLVQAGELRYTDLTGNATLIGQETPVRGIVFQTIKRPTIRPKKNQTDEDFVLEVQEWYKACDRHEGTTTGGPAACPQPYWHVFDEAHMTEGFYWQLRAAKRLSVAPEGDMASGGLNFWSAFPKTLDVKQCLGGPGMSPCAFLPMCSSTPGLYPTLVKRLYTQRKA